MKIQDQSGISLVELITVIAIIGILAAFAGFEILKAQPNFELRSLAHDVLATMQRARSLAVQQNTSVSVEFSDSGYKLIQAGSSDPIASVSFSEYGASEFVTSGKCGAASGNWNDANPYSTMDSVTFDSRGGAKADSGASGTVYFDNGLDKKTENIQCYAITIQITGGMKLRKYNGMSDEYDRKYWLE